MTGSGDTPKPSGLGKTSIKNDGKSKPSPPKARENDDDEDGDLATPKRDRDDEQQGL